jgi:pentatricopeptide repeat protein
MITEILKNRFFQNMTRHPDLEWEFVEARLSESKEALEVLRLMEESGGEPDTIGSDEETGKLIFCDCSEESPSGRRSLCYDEEALEKRKKNPPKGSAMHQAQEMGVSVVVLTHYASEDYGFKEYYKKICQRTGLRCVYHTDTNLL